MNEIIAATLAEFGDRAVLIDLATWMIDYLEDPSVRPDGVHFAYAQPTLFTESFGADTATSSGDPMTAPPISAVTASSAPLESAHAALRGRIGGLDGLRGLAVAGVLLFHDDLLIGGFLGVDLFFALSGFLITGLLITEHTSSGRVDLVHFWKRRARRLLPAALVFLMLITPLMYVFGTAAQVEASRDGVIPAMLYVANWAQIADSAQYWALFTEPSPLTHLWSLAVEEQFYVLWPLIAIASLRGVHARRRLGVVTAVGIVASFVAMLVLFDPANPTRVYMGTDTRAASILVGALAAIVSLDGHLERLAKRTPSVVAGGQLVAAGRRHRDVGDGRRFLEHSALSRAALAPFHCMCCARRVVVDRPANAGHPRLGSFAAPLARHDQLRPVPLALARLHHRRPRLHRFQPTRGVGVAMGNLSGHRSGVVPIPRITNSLWSTTRNEAQRARCARRCALRWWWCLHNSRRNQLLRLCRSTPRRSRFRAVVATVRRQAQVPTTVVEVPPRATWWLPARRRRRLRPRALCR